MALFGLPFDPKSKKKTWLYQIIPAATVLIMHIILIFGFYSSIDYILHAKSTKKTSMSLAISMVLNVWLWHVAFRKRSEMRQICHLLLIINPNSSNRKLCSVFNILTSLTIIMPMLCSMVLWYDGKETQGFRKDVGAFFKFIGLPEDMRYLCIFLLFLFESGIQNMLTLLFSLIFQDLGQSILLCKEEFFQTSASVIRVIRIYEKIVVCKNLIENRFGRVLFLLTSLGLLNAFGNITVILGFETGKFTNPASVYCISIFSTVNFSIWVYLMLSAANVNENDQYFKNEIYLYVLRRRVRCMQNESAWDVIVFGQENITFSANGYFRFTKGFILTAIGGLLTYSLLLNQFQIKQNYNRNSSFVEDTFNATLIH
ncbi:hypothetical protein NPIL_113771 [Nephila pilipes]|uniref:Gustatory receptor n=1 Tax=Nephila pilipes TaxID=299642 RepID=A0A8X6PHQ7_NEPPI|nr:hypothetical protein NPIL_113771 [Nephila pilipes]